MGATTAIAAPIGPLRPCDPRSCERGAPLAVLDSFEFGQAQGPARAMRPDVAHRPEARLTAVRSTDGAPRDLGLFVGPLAQNCCGIVSHRWTTLVVVRPRPRRSDPRGGTSFIIVRRAMDAIHCGAPCPFEALQHERSCSAGQMLEARLYMAP
jgi:hypothetical protein